MRELRALNVRLRFRGIKGGLQEVCDQYDGFVLDQWGVLHNGAVAYPGVDDCLKKLHQQGKKLIILSNSSRRAEPTLEKLPSIGIERSVFIGAVTSGEQTYGALERR